MDINRKTAYLVLVDVESKKAYSNLALNHQMVINKPNAPGFVRELVYGVLENKLTLDYYIDLLVKDGVKSLKTPELIILRMGVYQIAHMGSVRNMPLSTRALCWPRDTATAKLLWSTAFSENTSTKRSSSDFRQEAKMKCAICR